MRSNQTMLLWGAILFLLSYGCASDDADGPTEALVVEEGYAMMEDSTRLYYQKVGTGEPVVVVPVGFYLAENLRPLAANRQVIFYDPRNRGRSEAADLATVSLDQQVEDLEQLRIALGLEQMALLGWSGLGMEMAVYALRYPERVTRMVQVAAVPPSASLMAEAGDGRVSRTDEAAIEAVNQEAAAGTITPEAHCRRYTALTMPANFEDPTYMAQVPDVCQHENEWPANLWRYFGALLRSFGDYDWRPALADLAVPRLVIHGREDGIPLAGAYAWVSGYDTARLIVLSPAGHFPFLEQPTPFFSAVDEFLAGTWPAEAVQIEE